MQLFEMSKNIRKLRIDFDDLKQITDLIYNLKAKDIYFNNKYNQGNVLFNKENVQVAIEALADVVDKLSNDGNNTVIPWTDVVGKPFEEFSVDFEVKENILSLKQNIFSSISHTHKEYAPHSHSTNDSIHVTDIEKEDIHKVGKLELSNINKFDNVEVLDNKMIFKSGEIVKKEVTMPNVIDTTQFAKATHTHLTSDIEYTNDSYPDVKNIKHVLDMLLYTDLVIAFNSNINPKLEKGIVVNSVIFNWSYNKDVLSQDINGKSIDKSLRSYNDIGSFSSNKKFTITSNDGTKSFSKNIEFVFYDGLYYGTSLPTGYNDEFILKLNKTLTNSKSKTFSVDCVDNEYIYYCIPSYFGTPEFIVGGFSGGFIKDAVVQFINAQGHSETYDVYRSKNSGLGNTTVIVK